MVLTLSRALLRVKDGKTSFYLQQEEKQSAPHEEENTK